MSPFIIHDGILPTELNDNSLFNTNLMNHSENEENEYDSNPDNNEITDVVPLNNSSWTWFYFFNTLKNVILFDLRYFIYYLFCVIGWLIIVPLIPILLCCNAPMFVKEISYQNYKNQLNKIN